MLQSSAYFCRAKLGAPVASGTGCLVWERGISGRFLEEQGTPFGMCCPASAGLCGTHFSHDFTPKREGGERWSIACD